MQPVSNIFFMEPFIIKVCRLILVCLKPVNCEKSAKYIVDPCIHNARRYGQSFLASCKKVCLMGMDI